MSESVQHDEQGSSLHDRCCLRYVEQCSPLHAEGLKTTFYTFISFEIGNGTYFFRRTLNVLLRG